MLLVLSAPASGVAEPNRPALGSGGSGLRGLVYTGLPLAASELNLSLTAGYGLTDAFEPVDGVHHRGQATFGAALSPLPWLSFALRFDGRLELHPDDGEGAHSAGFGDPRLFARAGHMLSPELGIGAELGGWFPGTDAPSIDSGASTAEARGLVSYTPARSPWVALAALGFRLDNSAHTAPDLRRLRLGDRISLGLSDSNAILAALGVAYRFGRNAEAFTELSADMLVGSRAPPLQQSPLRAALGGRYFVTSSLQLDLTALVSLSARPDVGSRDALVPIEPRVLMLAGVRYSVDLAPAAALSSVPRETKPTTVTEVVDRTPKTATLAGVLVDDKGAPLPEASVSLHVENSEAREVISDAQGRYSFEGVPVGPASIQVSATGFETQSFSIDVRADMPPESPRALVPKTDSGVLRGLIRTFASEPLAAQIMVRDRRGRNVASRESAADGHFEIDLPPGSYEVTIRARGYKSHRRMVKVEGNGVSILNVDMREGE